VVLPRLHVPPRRPKSWIASTAAMPRLPLSPRISPPPPPQISPSPLSQVLNPSTASSPTASAAAASPRQTRLQGDSSRRRDNILQRREAVRDPAAGAHQGQRLHRQQRRRAGLPPATSGSPEATTTAPVPSPSVTPTPSSPRQVRSRLSLLPTHSWTTEDVAASSPSPQQSRRPPRPDLGKPGSPWKVRAVHSSMEGRDPRPGHHADPLYPSNASLPSVVRDLALPRGPKLYRWWIARDFALPSRPSHHPCPKPEIRAVDPPPSTAPWMADLPVPRPRRPRITSSSSRRPRHHHHHLEFDVSRSPCQRAWGLGGRCRWRGGLRQA
jgi:hypothetical protein